MRKRNYSNVKFVNIAVKGNLKSHVDSVHEGKKPFKCENCDYSCAEKGDLQKHITSVHEGKKPFNCESCDYKFAHKSDMKRHVAFSS